MNEVVHTHARPILPQGGEEFYRAYDVEEDTRRSAYHYDQDAEFYFTHTGGEWNVYSCLVWEPGFNVTQAQEKKLDMLIEAMHEMHPERPEQTEPAQPTLQKR